MGKWKRKAMRKMKNKKKKWVVLGARKNMGA